MTKRLRSCDQHPRYQAGCAPCNDRSRLYEKQRAAALLRGERLSASAEHVAARLRELRAAGYRLQDLAAHSGMNFRHLWELSTGRPGQPYSLVQLKTFHAVEKMYAELRPFPGPSRHAALWAQRRGWEPPEPLTGPDDWDGVDPVLVERACDGDPVAVDSLNHAETVAAWDLLGRRGVPEKHRIKQLRVGDRTVEKWRAGAPERRRSLSRRRTG